MANTNHSLTIAKNPIVLGGLISDLATSATGTLVTTFLLQVGLQALNIRNFGACAITILITFLIDSSKVSEFTKSHWGWTLSDIGWTHFSRFMAVEALANIVCGVSALITGNAWFAIVFCLCLVPFNQIQALGINVLKAKSFSPEDRKAKDDFDTKYSSIVMLVGIGIGFVLNIFCSGAVGFAILCAAEVVNNIFYLKAYKEISAKSVEVEVSEEEDEEAEPVSA